MATAHQIATYAVQAGVRNPVDLARAVAVALAESGGNPRAHNGRPPDDSYGLWQINMYGSLGPARRQQFGISSNDALYDPATNAKAMYAISGGGKNWKPWTTYGGARFLLFWPVAQTAATAALAGAAAGAAGDAAGAVGEGVEAIGDGFQLVGSSVFKAGAWLSDRNNIFRIVKVVGGGALLIGGIGLAARNSVMAFVPMGKAAKMVGKAVA